MNRKEKPSPLSCWLGRPLELRVHTCWSSWGMTICWIMTVVLCCACFIATFSREKETGSMRSLIENNGEEPWAEDCVCAEEAGSVKRRSCSKALFSGPRRPISSSRHAGSGRRCTKELSVGLRWIWFRRAWICSGFSEVDSGEAPK